MLLQGSHHRLWPSRTRLVPHSAPILPPKPRRHDRHRNQPLTTLSGGCTLCRSLLYLRTAQPGPLPCWLTHLARSSARFCASRCRALAWSPTRSASARRDSASRTRESASSSRVPPAAAAEGRLQPRHTFAHVHRPPCAAVRPCWAMQPVPSTCTHAGSRGAAFCSGDASKCAIHATGPLHVYDAARPHQCSVPRRRQGPATITSIASSLPVGGAQGPAPPPTHSHTHTLIPLVTV